MTCATNAQATGTVAQTYVATECFPKGYVLASGATFGVVTVPCVRGELQTYTCTCLISPPLSLWGLHVVFLCKLFEKKQCFKNNLKSIYII